MGRALSTGEAKTAKLHSKKESCLNGTNYYYYAFFVLSK